MNKLGRPTTHVSTDFALWMSELGYTNEQAARALDISIARVGELKRGTSYTSGRDGAPDHRTRLAMAAIKAGLPPYAPSNDTQP
jgi:hypothetical protein